MRIPVVMPAAHVHVEAGGALRIDLDDAPYDAQRPLHRSDLKQVLAHIATELQSPIRVDVIEADGTTYTDITTPAEPAQPVEVTSEPAPRSAPGLEATGREATGLEATGFRPGEQVAVVLVLAQQRADNQGAATVRLPPAILAARRERLALVGLSSGAVTPLGEMT